MRSISAILLLISIASSVAAQIDLPELSPRATTKEVVGYTTIEIHYGRPAARQRKIMGELVPYKRLWRTGAGKCSVIKFDQPVVIGNKTVAPGAYALVAIPDEKEWTVFLNSDTSKIYGDPSEYDPRTEAVSFKVIPEKEPRFHESLTMSMDIIQYDAVFSLVWENTRISFPIRTGTYEKACAAILESISQNPSDPERLSQAAWFHYMNNGDPQQMLAWVDKALEKGDDRWLLEQRFDILERMKNYGEARKAADRAIAFLRTTKPISWEDGVRGYQERMKRWPKNVVAQ